LAIILRSEFVIFDFFMTSKPGGFLSMSECQFQPQEGYTQKWKWPGTKCRG